MKSLFGCYTELPQGVPGLAAISLMSLFVIILPCFFLATRKNIRMHLFTATMANHCLILFWGSLHVLKCQWITGSLVLLRCWEGHWFGQGSLISLAAIAWRGHPNRSHRRKTGKTQHLQFPISTTWISCEYHHIWWWRLPMFYIVLWCLVVFDDGDQPGLGIIITSNWG